METFYHQYCAKPVYKVAEQWNWADALCRGETSASNNLSGGVGPVSSHQAVTDRCGRRLHQTDKKTKSGVLTLAQLPLPLRLPHLLWHAVNSLIRKAISLEQSSAQAKEQRLSSNNGGKTSMISSCSSVMQLEINTKQLAKEPEKNIFSHIYQSVICDSDETVPRYTCDVWAISLDHQNNNYHNMEKKNMGRLFSHILISEALNTIRRI